MRVLILCAGEARRWGNYLGAEKQLVEVEGEILLHRTIRQCLHNEITDITVVAPTVGGKKFSHPNADLYTPVNTTPSRTDADKFLSSREMWNPTGRTAVLYGDVWYSDRAIHSIVTHSQPGWGVWRRPHKSRLTGCAYGEVFALGWRAEDHEMVDKVLAKAVQTYRTSNRRVRPAGWQMLAGFKLNPPGRAYVIDDWTEDFDHPKDLDTWLSRRIQLAAR